MDQDQSPRLFPDDTTRPGVPKLRQDSKQQALQREIILGPQVPVLEKCSGLQLGICKSLGLGSMVPAMLLGA